MAWNEGAAATEEALHLLVHAALTVLSNPKQEAVKAAIREEQRRSEKAVEEAVKRTRDELVEYVREQRRVSVLCAPAVCL